MKLDEIRTLVRDVFGHSNVEEIHGWASLRCPLAPWTHESGKDGKASAGISIQETGVSVFNCFTCGNKAPIQAMLKKYAGYTGENLDDLIEELEEMAYLGPRDMDDWDKPSTELAPLVPLKEAVYLDLYDPAAGHPYLLGRGISDETANKLQLMLDPCDPADGEERILFPVFGPGGELYGLSGRATHEGARLKVRDYFGLPKARCLLGAHLIAQEDPDKVLIVEGLFDYAKGWQNGFPVVAVMHSTLTEAQADIVRGFGKPTYSFYDDDKAGKKGTSDAGNLLYNYVPYLKTRYPEIWIDDPDDEDHGGHLVKDPGELEADEMQEMLEDAILWYPEEEYDKKKFTPGTAAKRKGGPTKRR